MNKFSIPEMTFNREMVWLDEERILGGGIIAWSKCGRLRLSGKEASSNWHLAPDEGSMTALSDESRINFNTEQAITARMFIHEFLVDQHPDLFFEVGAGDRSAVVKIVFDRWLDYSPLQPAPLRTLYGSENISGKEVRIPLAEILRARGYKTRYMRVNLHLEFGSGKAKEAKFRAWSDSKPVLVAELPRSLSVGRCKPAIPISAVFVDENGEMLHEKDGVSMTANGGGHDYKMVELGSSGIFQAGVALPKPGEYRFSFKATRNGVRDGYLSETNISVTDGEFVRHHYDKQGRHAGYMRGSRHLGFMSGSTVLSEAVAAVNVGTEKEKIILDSQELLKNTGQAAAKTGCVWMTSLNDAELEEWLEHRRKNGYRVFLMANWSPEILNAGGAISPYGAEITAKIFDFCRKHDIYLKVDIIHDTFSRAVAWHGISFPNLVQYKEAGFLKDYEKELDLEKSIQKGTPCFRSYPNYGAYRDDNWCLAGVRKLTEKYFRHFCLLFRDETAIMLLSPCGEADFEIGARLVNPFIEYLRKHDGNHLFCVDQRGQLMRFHNPLMETYGISCPFQEKHSSIACVAGYGKYKNDAWAGVMLKFFGLNANVGPVEGDCYAPSWPSYYEKPFHPAEECMRLMVRDFLWLCLVHRYFTAYNWNELFMAEEHLIPREVSKLIDWKRFEGRVAPVFLRVHEPREDKDIDRLVAYEEIFSRLGLEYDYIWDKDPLPGKVELFAGPDRQKPPYLVLDANMPEDELRNYAWPQSVESRRIVRLEGGCYAANGCISGKGDQAIIYLRNSSNYVTREWFKNQTSHWYKVKCQRGDLIKGDFKLELKNLSSELKNLRVYDLNAAKIIKEEKISSSWTFFGKDTTHDFAVILCAG